MRQLTFLIIIFAVLILRPYQLQSNGLMYSGDDTGYFAHTSAIVFGEFPSYEKEYYAFGKDRPINFIGPSLMAVPFVWVGSLIDRCLGSDIVVQRTKQNIQESWSLFGFVFASNFYFCLGCFLLYNGLRYYYAHRHTILAILFMVFVQGIPLFAFRRPVFSHAYEFFLQCCFVFLLLRPEGPARSLVKKWRFAVGVIGLSVLTFLTRFNNFFAALLWPLVIFKRERINEDRRYFYDIIALIFVCGAGIYTFFYFNLSHFGFLLELFYQYKGVINSLLFKLKPLSVYFFAFLKSIHVLDWGLLYIAPFILIAGVGMFLTSYPSKRNLLLCMIPMAVNLFVILHFGGSGSWYGRRYFTTSLIPLLVYPLAHILMLGEGKFGKRIYFLWGFIAFFPLISMLSFEGNNTTLTLATRTGAPGWGNPTYQLEVWKMMLFHPMEWLAAVFKGGVLYFVYLMACLLKMKRFLPGIVLLKYPVFQLSVLIKVAMLYSLPVFLSLFFRRDFSGDHKVKSKKII